ncbi:hypothetical protein BDW22DRAFT_122363 [Trametopsis cervina]|nr:hypothetical protein BDW22DRAFT_122363 [Trametopsis cervina]
MIPARFRLDVPPLPFLSLGPVFPISSGVLYASPYLHLPFRLGHHPADPPPPPSVIHHSPPNRIFFVLQSSSSFPLAIPPLSGPGQACRQSSHSSPALSFSVYFLSFIAAFPPVRVGPHWSSCSIDSSSPVPRLLSLRLVPHPSCLLSSLLSSSPCAARLPTSCTLSRSAEPD